MATASNISIISDGTLSVASSGGVGGSGAIYASNNQTWKIIADSTNEDSGSLNVAGDIKIKGQSLSSWMQTVDERLLILRPKPELLEKYESLREAYEHYKTLEALLHEDTK